MSPSDSNPPVNEEQTAKASARASRGESLFGKPLGEVVQALYGIPRDKIEEGLDEQRSTGKKLGDVLVERETISEEQLSACLALAAKKETTFLSHAFLSPLKHHWWGRHFQLMLEGFFVTLTSFFIVHAVIDLQPSGLISLFLFSAALTTRFNVVLADVDLKNEIIDVLALFAGILMAFVGVAVVLEPKELYETFDFVLDAGRLSPWATLENRNFGAFNAILFNNVKVFLTIVMLSFIYRGYAAVLILAWNGCTWGLTLTLLAAQSLEVTEHSAIAYIVGALTAIAPHLILESVAYIGGSVGSIGISRLLLWHDINSPRFRQESRRFVIMLVVSGIMVVVGALVEAHWAPLVLRQF